MKRKFLEGLGIQKDAIDRIMAENGKDVNKAKADYEAIEQDRKVLAALVAEQNNQLKLLKKAGGESRILKQRLSRLQAENKSAKEKYEADMKRLFISSAVRTAIAACAYDVELVAGLIDQSKLFLSEDGKVTGLEEQLMSLKETKAFLFKDWGEITGADVYKAFRLSVIIDNCHMNRI